MRGAERPAKVCWTHPFILPLHPLSDDAAKQTFMDITDNLCANEDISQLLQFTDNMPLAVDLIAHLSEYEGCSNVLNRWEVEKISLLSLDLQLRMLEMGRLLCTSSTSESPLGRIERRLNNSLLSAVILGFERERPIDVSKLDIRSEPTLKATSLGY
jgi:hypothetical protein